MLIVAGVIGATDHGFGQSPSNIPIVVGRNHHLSNDSVIYARDLAIGDVVAQGERIGDGACYYERTKLIRQVAENGKTKRIVQQNDAACRMIVVEISERPYTKPERSGHAVPETPSRIARMRDYLVPVFSRAALTVPQRHRVPMNTAKPMLVSLKPASSRVGAPPQFYSGVSNHVFHYGGGGAYDQLTWKDGDLSFGYDGSSITLEGHGGECGEFFWWNILTCEGDQPSVGEDYIQRSGVGTYSWMFEYFWHLLVDIEWAYAWGMKGCDYSFAGSIVNGVSQECGGW
jgi:hypothetical protein